MVAQVVAAALRVSLVLFKVMLMLPFVAVRSLRRLTAFGRGALLLLGQDDARCGHCGSTLVLTARWRCRRCGYVWLGYGFSRCPLCAEPSLFLNCQSCGTSIRNPLP
jgi:hypothetical protein